MVAISTGAAILGASLLSGAMSMGSSALSSGLSLYKSAKLAEHQAAVNYQYAEKSARNTPTWNRAGLESAGYNPMLAVQNATSGANSSWASPQDSSVPDFSNSLAAGIANAQSFKRLENETKTAEAQQDQAYAEADKAKVEKQSLLQKLPFVSQREKAEIGNIEKDSLLKESQIHNMDETTRFIQKRYELDKMLGEMGIATARRGQDLTYNASTYASNIAKYGHDKSYGASVWSSGLAHPYSKYLHKVYNSGRGPGVSGYDSFGKYK